MSIDLAAYNKLLDELQPRNVRLVAVSKTKPVEDIKELYDAGQRDFGENYVQELVVKQTQLPDEIRWHFIGHLQSNKIKMIAPFVHLIHGVDSMRLLEAINKEGKKIGRRIKCLLQVHIAREESKFGFDTEEAKKAVEQVLADHHYDALELCGLMGMASFTDDHLLVEQEFKTLKRLFDEISAMFPDQQHFNILSMGMSGDYKLAMGCGSNMIRIGSMLFGSRN